MVFGLARNHLGVLLYYEMNTLLTIVSYKYHKYFFHILLVLMLMHIYIYIYIYIIHNVAIFFLSKIVES